VLRAGHELLNGTVTITRLNAQQLDQEIQGISSWKVVNGKLRRELSFPDFVTAFGFMAQIALIAERDNHHPEWSNVYNRVTIDLTTHEASGISERDIAMAKSINSILSRLL